jgi:hypothetical protein
MSRSVGIKLGLKNGQRALVLDPPEGYEEVLNPSVEGVEFTQEGVTEPGSLDFVQLFVKDSTALDARLKGAIQAVKQDGLLWISYPKKTSKIKSDIHRDILWAKVEPHGWSGVALISIDDSWSAMRFRPSELVKSTRSK